MNESTHESAGNMGARWLGWAWVLPQLFLAGLNWYAWILVRGDMSPLQHSRAVTIGAFEALLLAAGGLAWIGQTVRKKPIGIGLALAAIAGHTGYLWWFIQSLDHLLPTTVNVWMLPETELLFYQFSLIMPVVFLMLVRLARIRLRLSAPLDVGLSLAVIVLVPSAAFILGSLLARLSHAFTRHDGVQTILIAALVAGTAFILVAFLRLMIRLHDLIQSCRWSEWALPLAAGLAAPLAGLALNASIPFPYDFQDAAVYAMAILNGVALLIPFRPGTRWAFPGWAARVAMYPFSVYFFLVFLPFLPLSLLAMIAAGSGFLILAPLFLFVIHSRRLWEQGSVLAVTHGASRVAAAFVACLLVLPAAFLLRNEADRLTLNRAVDAVFSPDYSATRLPVHPGSLRRALARMADLKHGIYLPYLSDLYNAMVFHGMVLPDDKAALIEQSLLGKVPSDKDRAGLFGRGFLGGRNRGERRGRTNTATHQVVLAAHARESTLQTNGVSETEIRFDLENRGAANGEFAEPITLPEGVLVTGFWLSINGTNKPAQIRERKAATWVYEMIRDMTRRDPGLLVYEGDRHLRLRVYPFAAGEKRRCGISFRYPSTWQPSIRISDTVIPLAGHPADAPQPLGVSATLADHTKALAAPATVTASWPSFRREEVAHLILDRSAAAGTNRAAVAAQAQAALAALPPAITRVRLTWANYEQEDLPGDPVSRAEAGLALDRAVSLPFRGGFCPDRVIARVLLAASREPQQPLPAGDASLFVVVPAPGSKPVQAASLAPFARLAPDLPVYAVYGAQGLTPIPFDPSAKESPPHPDLMPAKVAAIRSGTGVTLVPPDQDAVLFSEDSTPATWEAWNPAAGQFEKLEGLADCADSAYRAGLALWTRHRALALTPGQLDAALPDLIQGARTSNLLIPEAAFMVVETQSQDVILSRKERQSLGANHALEFDEGPSQKAPAPPALWLLVPALWLLWRKRPERARA